MTTKIDKSFTKKDLLEFIELYEMDIDDTTEMPKVTLQFEIMNYLKCASIEENAEYPMITCSADLISYLEKEKPNTGLNYKEKQEIIHIAKSLIQYCRGSYCLSLSNYNSIDEIYQEGLKVAEHCDIPTCRRAVQELNKDNKIRNKIILNISSKVKEDISKKKQNKLELTPTFKLTKGYHHIVFD
tara:strand:- start:2256 stop:2810 length:555 start_codon:yes stop_codon:yes gene_type:complete